MIQVCEVPRVAKSTDGEYSGGPGSGTTVRVNGTHCGSALWKDAEAVFTQGKYTYC